MSVPANTSALTAIAIPSVPYSATQDVNDGGTTYTVWYAYTVTSADVAAGVIGVWGFGAVGGYNPTTTIFEGPASAPVSTGISGTNVPLELPVDTVGETFYFRFAKNGNDSPAILTVSVVRGPNQSVPVGAVGINDASPGFPLVFLDADTGEVLRLVNPFPAGESLWIQPTGELLVEDISVHTTRLYDARLRLIASQTITGGGTHLFINGNTAGSRFYVGRSSAGQAATVSTVSLEGVVGATVYTGLGTNLHALAPSPDETILYYALVGNGAVKRWDLVNNVGLSDFVATLGGSYVPGDDILVLPDETVLVQYRGGSPHLVKHYSAAGATLQTYNMAVGETLEAIYPTSTDGSTFGVWVQPDSQYSEFKTLRVSDGSTVRTTGLTQKYNDGVYQGSETATPLRFGSSFSCQPFMQRTALPSNTRKPVPVPTSLAPQTPCTPQTQVSNGGKGQAGCNTGGVGHVSSWTGDYGDVPQHPDPPEGERLTGKEFHRIGFWVEIHHVDYPSETVTVYRRALGPDIADLPDFEGGRKAEGVTAIGDIEHGLGNEQGDDEAATVDIEFTDIPDRLFRNLLETQELEGDEIYVKVASKAARNSGSPAEIARVLFRGKIQRATLEDGLRVRISAVDVLFAEDGPFGPGKTWPPQIPDTLWPNAPPDTASLNFPVLWGEKTDIGAIDPITGEPSEKGLVPLYYVGQQSLTELGGTVPDPVPITINAAIPAPTLKALTRTEQDGGWDASDSGYAYVAAVVDGEIGSLSAQGVVGPHLLGPAGIGVHFDKISDDYQVQYYIIFASNNAAYHPVTNATAGRVGTATHYGQGASDFWWGTTGLEDRLNPGTFIHADYSVDVIPPAVAVGDEIWDAYLVVLGRSTRISALYGSDLGGGDPSNTHDRTKLVLSERNGSDILTPWDDDGNVDPNWPFAETYITYTDPVTGIDYDCTMVFARGPLSDDHKNGVVNLTCNLIGRPDNDGLPILHVERVRQAWTENDILLGYTSGPLCDNTTAPTFRDGVYMVKSSTFRARENFEIASLGGIGLRAAWYIGATQAKAVSEWQREWFRTTEAPPGRSSDGQVIIGGLDTTIDPSDWPAVRQAPDIFGPITRVSGEERENVSLGSCDWDDDAEKFRLGPITVTAEDAIVKYKNRRKPGEPVESTILGEEDHLRWVLNLRSARLRYGLTLVEVPMRLDALDTEVGSGLSLYSREGVGASGYQGQKCHVMRRRISVGERIVTDTLWDVQNTLIASRYENGLERLFIATDDTGHAPQATDDPDLTPIATL